MKIKVITWWRFPSIALRIRSAHNTGQLATLQNGEPSLYYLVGKLSQPKVRARWPTCEEWEMAVFFSPRTRLVTYKFFSHNFFSLTPPLCAVKIKKKFTSEKKVTRKKVFVAITRGHKIVSSVITHPRNICNQCFFMPCAGVIKQTLNYSFWTMQYTCFVISSVMSKLCLLFRPNVAWTDGRNLSLIDEVAMIKWVTWENYISQTSLVTYVFYCTFQVTIMWRTIEKKLKKILRQLLLLRNHLKCIEVLQSNHLFRFLRFHHDKRQMLDG